MFAWLRTLLSESFRPEPVAHQHIFFEIVDGRIVRFRRCRACNMTAEEARKEK